jgi:carbon storage regulator
MLVETRQVNEKIMIGDNIVVTIIRIEQGQVRIGIEAPREIKVLREELVGTPPNDQARDQRNTGHNQQETESSLGSDSQGFDSNCQRP